MLYFRVGKAESMFVLFAFVKELSAAQLLPLIIAMSKDKVANIKISVATILKVGALASQKEARSIVTKRSAHNRAWFCVLVYHVNLNAFCHSLFSFQQLTPTFPATVVDSQIKPVLAKLKGGPRSVSYLFFRN